MDILVLIGRILFASLFIGGGINHFVKGRDMAGFAAAKGVPAALATTYASGAVLLAGGLSVLLGVWADLGSLLIVVFLVPTALLMHAYWKEEGQERMVDMVNFQKNISLAGAGLMLLAFFSYAGDDLGLTITGPLFTIS